VIEFDQDWESLGITRQFINAVKDMGFAAPTEIQRKAIPIGLGGQNIIGIAQTGTGKTAAYVLPILQRLKYHVSTAPRAVILLPTKELVKQVAYHVKLMAGNTDLKVAELYGGVGPKAQIQILEEGVDVIVSTPGRFEEIYLGGNIPTKMLKTLVVDEADRLMDMNFKPQLMRLLEWLPAKRQNLLFSATFSPRVEKLAADFMEFPVKIEITPSATPAASVKQIAYSVPNVKSKLNLLQWFFKHEAFTRVLIFARSKESVTNLAKFLERMDLGTVRAIHSNKGQNARHNAMAAFSDGEVRILVSTDVTARGIDIKDVSHVINFDVPVVYDDYVHRIGRTGRAQATGTAISLVTEADAYHIKKIEKHIREKIAFQELPPIPIEETPYAERQTMSREIDRQKRLENPDYRGAFHERKKK
jgi:ATP-dependent RNA helicase RhlE